jgi:hypothetical protein
LRSPVRSRLAPPPERVAERLAIFSRDEDQIFAASAADAGGSPPL